VAVIGDYLPPGPPTVLPSAATGPNPVAPAGVASAVGPIAGGLEQVATRSPAERVLRRCSCMPWASVSSSVLDSMMLTLLLSDSSIAAVSPLAGSCRMDRVVFAEDSPNGEVFLKVKDGSWVHVLLCWVVLGLHNVFDPVKTLEFVYFLGTSPPARPRPIRTR